MDGRGHTCFGLTTPEEIGVASQKPMPYCILPMTYQSMSIAGGDKQLIEACVEYVLRPRVLPDMEQAAPLDFSFGLGESKCSSRQ